MVRLSDGQAVKGERIEVRSGLKQGDTVITIATPEINQGRTESRSSIKK